MTPEEVEKVAAERFEEWWADMPENTKDEMATLGEHIRAGLRSAIQFGYLVGYRHAQERRDPGQGLAPPKETK